MTKSIESLQSDVQSLRVGLLRVQKQVQSISSLVTDISIKLSMQLGTDLVIDSMNLSSKIIEQYGRTSDTVQTPSTESGETPVKKQGNP